MKTTMSIAVLAALILFSGIAAHARMSEEAKIEALIASIRKMPQGTRFIRNGTEHGSEKAVEHLRTKYERGKKHAATAELFIKNIASQSSLSGIDYKIKFVDGKTVTAREFFTEELKKIENKEAAEPTAPRPPEPGAAALRLSGYTTVCMARDADPQARHLRRLWDGVTARHVPAGAFAGSARVLPGPERAQWINLTAMMPKLSPDQKLQYINGFFNNRASVTDSKNYNAEEYWATPEEFLQNGGDCEDFALAKYFALRYLGWPENDIWVVLVFSKKRQEHHAVLAARKKEKLFFLDNLSRPVYLLLPEKTFHQSFVPLYAINANGLWGFAAAGMGKR